MASYRFITLAIVLAILLPAVAIAKEHIVGDDCGWGPQCDYVAWAKNQVFVVGDTLVFNYPTHIHNVIKVNATEFIDCISSNLEVPVTSGHDVIPLSTPGKKWYICGKVGVVKHCDLGQKLVIDVLENAPASPPPPTPSAPAPHHKNAATGIMSSGSPPVIVAAVVLIMAMIMA